MRGGIQKGKCNSSLTKYDLNRNPVAFTPQKTLLLAKSEERSFKLGPPCSSIMANIL